jgi:hypothetical protein
VCVGFAGVRGSVGGGRTRGVDGECKGAVFARLHDVCVCCVGLSCSALTTVGQIRVGRSSS